MEPKPFEINAPGLIVSAMFLLAFSALGVPDVIGIGVLSWCLGLLVSECLGVVLGLLGLLCTIGVLGVLVSILLPGVSPYLASLVSVVSLVPDVFLLQKATSQYLSGELLAARRRRVRLHL